ncbi:MAG: pilus assembly protein TadG-related protein [Jatrophihabitans sp.]
MTASPQGREAGSATIWVISCCALLLVVSSVAALRAAAVVARHRAESGADLAALAAAGRIGVDGGTAGGGTGGGGAAGADWMAGISAGTACAAAARTAAVNGSRLRSCRVELAADARSGTVSVSVQATVHMPVVGTQQVVASARAGRLPAGLSGVGESQAGRSQGSPGRRE